MKTLPVRHESCRMFRAALPSLVEAMLRRAYLAGPCRETLDHVAVCPACAAELAEMLALVTWREAQDPFNADSVPLATGRLPGPEIGGVPCDRAAS
jgi:hypothetical protein